MKDVLAELERWQAEGEEIAIATLVSAWGSAPRLPGARFAMTRSGRVAGSLSGGCIEGEVLARAMEVLDDGQPQLLEYGISDEMAFGVGLSCGGRVEAFLEPFRPDAAWIAARDALGARRPCAYATALAPGEISGRHLTIIAGAPPVGTIAPEIDRAIADATALPSPGVNVITTRLAGNDARVMIEEFAPPPRLFIVGATHVAAALAREAKTLGFAVTVIDARRVFATPERFPDADEIVVGWPGDALNNDALDAHGYVVVVTHDLKFDVPALAAALRSDARYIGLLGSRATIESRMRELRELGFSDGDIGRIHAPIGLDLGGRSPEEIALAIAAEMTIARYAARPARAGRGPGA